MAERPIPEFLRKRGIRRVKDNIPPGYRVSPPKGLMTLMFGDLILEHFGEKDHGGSADA